MALKHIVRYGGLSLVVVAVAVAYANCGPVYVKHQKFPEIGEKVALAVTPRQEAKETDASFENVLIFFARGGRTFFYDEDYQIQMFANESDAEPLYEFSFNELKEMYRTTDCHSSLFRYVENAFEGDALFCNGALDLSTVNYIVAKHPSDEEEDKSATSYTVDYIEREDSIIAVSIDLQ